jgi:hypothetical protein
MTFFLATIKQTLPRLLMITVAILALTRTASGQEPPPRPIRINPTAQILSFGHSITVHPGNCYN